MLPEKPKHDTNESQAEGGELGEKFGIGFQILILEPVRITMDRSYRSLFILISKMTLWTIRREGKVATVERMEPLYPPPTIERIVNKVGHGTQKPRESIDWIPESDEESSAETKDERKMEEISVFVRILIDSPFITDEPNKKIKVRCQNREHAKEHEMKM